jgi:hypothetical protein
MKILGYILLTVALVGGGVSGFLWRYHTNQARIASTQQQNALSTASTWETADALHLRSVETSLENDQLALHNDNLRLQIAELEGHSTAAARSKVSTDEMLLSADKTQLSLVEMARAFGPSPHVTDAQEAAAAAHTRLSVATNWLSRDERFMYFSVGFLVLAGFAFAFAAKQGAQTAKP